MMRPLQQRDSTRFPLRGIAFVAGNERRLATAGPAPVVNFPPRPDPRLLSASIPLFFIGRNKYGFWVVRAAEGGAGGIFLLKRSALRFAAKNSVPAGCATMFLSERFELDVENQGSVLAAGLDAMIRIVAAPVPPPAPPAASRKLPRHRRAA
jgi:hypothetical protein